MSKRCVPLRHVNDDDAPRCTQCMSAEFEPIAAEVLSSEPAGDRTTASETTSFEGAEPGSESAPALILRFEDGWTVEVGSGEQVGIGRDPLWSPYAERLAAHLNVSRRHATVGIRADGHAWIRDHESANHTYRNDVAIRRNVPARLHDGDRIRLASTLNADVSIPGKADDRDES